MRGANSASPARPDGGQGRDLVHPGMVSLPGSSSVLAALSDSLDTRGIARETPPTLRLPGNPIPTPGRDLHNGFIPVVSARQTPRCSTRGSFIREGCVIRALNFSATNGEFGDHVRGGCAEGSPCVDGSLHPARMERAHGKVRAEDNSKISGA